MPCSPGSRHSKRRSEDEHIRQAPIGLLTLAAWRLRPSTCRREAVTSGSIAFGLIERDSGARNAICEAPDQTGNLRRFRHPVTEHQAIASSVRSGVGVVTA